MVAQQIEYVPGATTSPQQPTLLPQGQAYQIENVTAPATLWSVHFYQNDALSQMDGNGTPVTDFDLPTVIPDWIAVSTVNGNNGIWISRVDQKFFLTYQAPGDD